MVESEHFGGFVPIHTIFYALFHPTEGSKVKYQFPPNNLETHGIHFDSIKNYIIPKPALCHKLITFKYGNYRIVCYPVTVNAAFYARNFFSFNIVFVFPYDCQTSPYEPAIARLGKMFKVLEEQNQILSRAENDFVYFHNRDNLELSKKEKLIDSSSSQICATGQQEGIRARSTSNVPVHVNEPFSVYDLLMRVYQDLNNYSECLISIDKGNAVNIKIFPILKPPTPCISIEDVPMPTVNLHKIIDVNWDPTMLRIVPYVNGLNSISKIAKLSECDSSLVIECIRHFVYYQCVIFKDIFQFSNIYAPTTKLRNFLTDPSMASECQQYVVYEHPSNLTKLPFSQKNLLNQGNLSSYDMKTGRRRRSYDSRATSVSSISENDSHPNEASVISSPTTSITKRKQSESSLSSANSNSFSKHINILPTKACLFDLYRSLSQGECLKEWCKAKEHLLTENCIDVRRLVAFGLEKGIIYRCYTYPIINSYSGFDLIVKQTSHHMAADDVFPPNSDNVQQKHVSQNFDHNDEMLKPSLKNIGRGCNLTDTEKFMKLTDSAGSMKNSRRTISDIKEKSPVFKRLERPNKVSFNTDVNVSRSSECSSDGKFVYDNSSSHEVKQSAEQKLQLLNSIREAESLDHICVKMEKSRSEIEGILKNMGNIKFING